AAPGEASFRPERHAHQRGARLASDDAERAAEILVSRQHRGKFLSRDDGVDVLEQIADAGAHLLDVDDRRNAGRPRVARRLARHPRRAQVAIAVAICPPGSCATRWRRCFEFDTGYSATTATRSTLFSPKPATSNARESGDGTENGMRTAGRCYQKVRRRR